jgi:hypothetical protein
MVLGMAAFFHADLPFPISNWTFQSLFYLDFPIPFLFGIFYPLSIWTFLLVSIYKFRSVATERARLAGQLTLFKPGEGQIMQNKLLPAPRFTKLSTPLLLFAFSFLRKNYILILID